MSKLTDKFKIAAFTTSMAFNVMAANTDEVNPPPPQNDYGAHNQAQPNETGNFDDLGYEPINPKYTTDVILPKLQALETRSDVVIYMNSLMYDDTVTSLRDNAENSAESLDSYLEYSGVSPYFALPIALTSREGRETILQPDILEVLHKHGLDYKVFDDVVTKRTNDRTHLYDFLDDPIKDILEDPLIMIQHGMTQSDYSALPEPIIREIKDDLAFYHKIRAEIDPNYEQATLEDISPLTNVYQLEISDHEFHEGLKNLSDSDYNSALLGRNRNGIDVQKDLETIFEDITFEGGIEFAYAQNLMLPNQHENYSLVVMEPNNDTHSDMTYRYSEALAAQISPDNEGASDVHFVATSYNFEETTDNVTIAAYGASNVILSKSYGYSMDYKWFDDGYTRPITTNRVSAYEFHENNQTIQFIAAGNSFNGYHEVLDKDIGDSYQHLASSSQPESHAQRAVQVGAAHIKDDTIYMSSYTSTGAAFLMETPDFYGGKAQGTSFSTPTAAAYYHQIAESYGDTLSHEEIMMAALYSTETKVYDVNIRNAEKLDYDLSQSEALSNMSISEIVQQQEKNLTSEQIQNFNLTLFRTNAAGVPHQERAGAGFLNVDRWIENLNEMKAIKSSFEHEAEYIKNEFPLTAPEKLTDDDIFKYRYTITADQDMTLDKQTLYMDQSGLNSIRITSPSGMEANFIGSLSGYVSTRAFSGEDIKAGEEITIETNIPLNEFAEFTLRGFEDGNPIQAYREHKLEHNNLEANSYYCGDIKLDTNDAAFIETTVQGAQQHLTNILNEDMDVNTPPIQVGPQPF